MDPRGAGGVGRNRPDRKERDRAQAGRNARDKAGGTRADAFSSSFSDRAKRSLGSNNEGQIGGSNNVASRDFGGYSDRANGGRSTTKTPTPPELKAWMTALGTIAPAPFGPLMKVGDWMGDKVGELQADVDAGRIKSQRKDDGVMGRVDVVGGRPNSFGNAATDDRTANVNGFGGGMTGGGNSDEERRRRRAAAMQTALGSNINSLLGPGVEPI